MNTVRPGRLDDLAAINDLYNHYIASSACTFDIVPHDFSWRQEWFSRFAEHGRYRLLVADEGSGAIGYVTSSRHRDKHAYDTSVETSVYVSAAHTGRGVGRALYHALFEAIRGEDVHRALAGITLPNDPSVALHESLGFRRAGLFSEQGRKFGRYWDVAWYERPL